jgi:hypothetical protein
MGGGDPNIYQSPNAGSVDQLIQAIGLGTVSGGAISPNTTLSGQLVAQQIGGAYDSKTGQVIAPDGAKFKFDPTTGKFTQASSKGTMTIPGPRDPRTGMPTTRTVETGTEAKPSEWADKINTAYADVDKNVFSNPYSAWSSLGGAFSPKYYNKETGLYETPEAGAEPPTQQSAEDYFKQYGGYLDKSYTPTEYQQSTYEKTGYSPSAAYQTTDYTKSSPYQQYGYQAQDVKDLAPVADSAWEAEYNKRAGDTESRWRGREQEQQDWLGQQGSSLASGRRLAQDQAMETEKQGDLDKIRAEVEGEKAQQKFSEAGRARDLGLQYGWEAEKAKGEESRYGQGYDQAESRYAQEWGKAMSDAAQKYNQEESRYGQTWGRDENQMAQEIARQQSQTGQEWARDEGKYAYEDTQKLGREKMTAAESMDSAARDRSWQENQANTQNVMNMLSYYNDLMKTYAGQDATAAQYAASQSQAIGSALGGLMGGVGTAASGKL